MALTTTLYNVIGKRTSTYVLSVMVGAFAFERLFDAGTDKFFEVHNQGKLWQDLKHKYESKDD